MTQRADYQRSQATCNVVILTIISYIYIMEPSESRYQPPAPEIESTPETHPVTDEWFMAYVKGNLTLPQTYTGITLFVGQALLKEPAPDVEEFNDSHFTPEQVSQLRIYINRVHHAHGINAYTPGMDGLPQIPKPAESIEITDERIQHLWRDAKDAVLPLIANLIITIDPMSPVDPDAPNDDLSQAITTYLKSNPQVVSDIEACLDSAVATLQTPEARKWITEHRNAYKNWRDNDDADLVIKTDTLSNVSEHIENMVTSDFFRDLPNNPAIRSSAWNEVFV